ncbi:hypothetical protein [Pseudomonas sp. R45(2017)]|uniref:hypothetical protein n=1 Tax=Pseudomonas sp. R45(2017) TaxID=1981678 RepID=UPI000A1DC8E6|nr:hypothetical protein [Pseudomonas sp. R45(2017)]
MNLKLLKDVLPIILGVVFGVLSIAFGYLLVMFCSKLISSAGFSWLGKKVEEAKVFDFAILVALLTFFGKEFLDSRRKKKEQGRRVKACKVLLAEELRLNYYAQKTLSRIFSEASKNQDSEDRPKLEYKLIRGMDFFSYTDSQAGSGAMTPIPKVSFKYYDRFVDTVAELDARLFESMQLAYVEMREIEHVRVSLVNFMQVEEEEAYIPKDIRDNGFVDYASDVVSDAYGPMNDFYFMCSGKALTQSQLR